MSRKSRHHKQRHMACLPIEAVMNDYADGTISMQSMAPPSQPKGLGRETRAFLIPGLRLGINVTK
jgi:hypothetical protein